MKSKSKKDISIKNNQNSSTKLNTVSNLTKST